MRSGDRCPCLGAFSSLLRWCAIACLGLLFFGAGCRQRAPEIQRLAADQPIRVEARVDRAVAAVGDKIIFTLLAVVRTGMVVDLPVDLPGEGRISGLEVRDVQISGPKKLGPDQLVYRSDWVLSPVKVGAYILPGVEVPYRMTSQDKEPKKIKTSSVYLDVRSVLKEKDLQGDIRDIKGPVGLPSSLWLWFAVLGGTATAVFLAFIFYRYWSSRRPAVPPILPHEWALAQLARLLASGLLQKGRYKEFAAELSGIFRVYVEKRFGIMAPERTTEEFVLLMKDRREFDQEQQVLVGKFLAFCDMIKFAKYAPTTQEMSGGVGVVRNFVEKTIPAPSPAEGGQTSKVAQG